MDVIICGDANMDKSNINNRYSTNLLKNGYEEMAKINLSFAESAIATDASELLSYETDLGNGNLQLRNYFNMESDDFGD